jgi:hypothetical protein
MSQSAYREQTISPDEHTKLNKIVYAAASTTKLVALIRAQQTKAHTSNTGDGGFFRTLANTIEVAARSMSLSQEQTVFLEGLVQRYGIEMVSEFIEREGQLRHTFRHNLHLLAKPVETAERYQGQYDLALKTLDAFGIDCRGVPTWDDIAARLTPKKLALIKKLEGAQLILVPPQSRQDLVKAIDSKVGEYGIQYEIWRRQLEDDALWNNKKAEKDLAWEVIFADGRQNIPYNESVQAGKTIHEQVKALKALHEKDGVGTLVGARAHLTLMMQGLHAGEPLVSFTVINANVVADDKGSPVAYGYFSNGVCLGIGDPSAQSDALRLRAAVRV